METGSTSIALDYGKRSRRKRLTHIGLILFAVAVSVGVWRSRTVKTFADRAEFLWSQSRCLNFGVRKDDQTPLPAFTNVLPSYVNEAPPPTLYHKDDMRFTTFLMHGRRNRNGAERLIVIKKWVYAFSFLDSPNGTQIGSNLDLMLSYCVISPATWNKDLAGEERGSADFWLGVVPLGHDQSVQLDAEFDETDESHFVIVYKTAGGTGHIDGWLKTNDSIYFKFRDGPGKEFNLDEPEFD